MLMRLENSPPSAVFITCIAWNSGTERGAPITPTRSCVCGAFGRSTIRIFACVAAGVASIGAAGVPRCQRARVLTLLYELRETALPLTLDLGRRKSGMQCNVGREVERRGEVLLQRSRCNDRGVHRAVGIHGRAELRGLVGD